MNKNRNSDFLPVHHNKVKDKEGIKDPKSSHCSIIPALVLLTLLQIFDHLAHGKPYA
jgi:hypothetical protein